MIAIGRRQRHQDSETRYFTSKKYGYNCRKIFTWNINKDFNFKVQASH
jgi:hypothetical protein